MDRRYVNNRPTARGFHEGMCQLDEQKNGTQIRSHDRVPFFDGGFHQRLRHLNRGIINQSVERWVEGTRLLEDLHPWRRESIRRLAALKDIHKGKRAFVIANGPSLKQTDMSKLRNEFTFGMNRIYLMFPELGFSTTYLTVVNDLVIEQTASDLARHSLPKFLAWRSRRHFPTNLSGSKLPTFLYNSYTGSRFSVDVRGRVW